MHFVFTQILFLFCCQIKYASRDSILFLSKLSFKNFGAESIQLFFAISLFSMQIFHKITSIV